MCWLTSGEALVSGGGAWRKAVKEGPSNFDTEEVERSLPMLIDLILAG